jgi:hypothetical protein
MMLLAQASTQEPSAAGMAALAAFGVIYAIVILGIIAFSILCNWLIAKKAGFNPALSLLMLVPLANFIIYLIFVFGEWPIHAENRWLRSQLGLPPHGPLYPPGTGIPPSPPLPPGPGPIAPA